MWLCDVGACSLPFVQDGVINVDGECKDSICPANHGLVIPIVSPEQWDVSIRFAPRATPIFMNRE